MDNKEKIFQLLLKTELTDSEKKELEEIISSNKEAKEYSELFDKMKKASGSINYDDLANYVLFKNDFEIEDKSFHKKLPLIENHLRSSEDFSNEFKFLNSELNEINSFLSANYAQPEEKEALPILDGKNYFTARYIFGSLLAVGFLYLFLFAVSYLATPQYYKYTSIDDESDFYVTRGRLTEEFQQSLKSLEDGDYKNAIKFLELDIRKNPNEETIFYNHYILGLAYLEDAEQSFIGLFPSFNNYKAQQSLIHFKTAVEKNISGKYENINLDSYFYAAKANLMLDNTEAARNYLQKVVDEKGSKMDEAEKILSELE